MSLVAEGIWAASPSTTRGLPCPVSTDSKGERIAYTSNKSVFIRNIDNPAESRQFSASAVLTVARFSPSGFYIAVGDINGVVRIWDCVGEGALKGEYTILSGRINDLAWDGESARLIAVGNGRERMGHCISADSGNSVGSISGHSAQINCVSIRQQRPIRAATGSDDTSLAFFHGVPFAYKTSIQGKHSRYVYGTAFSPDGEYLVSVGADKKIWVHDAKTGESRKEVGSGTHTGSIFAVAWDRDSKRFVTCSADQTVRVWNVESGECVHSWRLGEEGKVNIAHHQVGVAWPRSDLIISVDLDGNFNYFSFDNEKPIRTVHGHQKALTAAVYTSEHKTLWTASADRRILAWDAKTGVAIVPDGQTHSNYVSGMAASADRVYSVGWDDTLRTIDIGTKSFVGSAIKTDGQPRGVCSSESLTWLASSNGVHSYKDGQPIGSSAQKSTESVCVASSGLTIAYAGQDETVRIEVDGKSSAQIKLSASSKVTALAFSATSDRLHLAIGASNGKIVVYTPGSSGDWEEVTSRWSAHTARVTCIAWSADGKRAASGGLDTHVFVWSLDDPGKRVKAMNAHRDGINGIAWLDDERVVTCGADGAVKTWRASP